MKLSYHLKLNFIPYFFVLILHVERGIVNGWLVPILDRKVCIKSISGRRKNSACFLYLRNCCCSVVLKIFVQKM